MIKTKVIKKQFNNLPIEFILDQEERPWVTAEQLGTALGYADPKGGVLRIYNRHKDLLSGFKGVVKLTTPGGMQDVVIFNETGCNIISLKSNTATAKEFVKWAAQVITDYRHGKLKKPKLPSAAFMKELRRICGDHLAKEFVKRELGLKEAPAEIIKGALTRSNIRANELFQIAGIILQPARFWAAVNANTLKPNTKIEIATILGLSLEDIWG